MQQQRVGDQGSAIFSTKMNLQCPRARARQNPKKFIILRATYLQVSIKFSFFEAGVDEPPSKLHCAAIVPCITKVHGPQLSQPLHGEPTKGPGAHHCRVAILRLHFSRRYRHPFWRRCGSS